jgi:hypothetical protein
MSDLSLNIAKFKPEAIGKEIRAVINAIKSMPRDEPWWEVRTNPRTSYRVPYVKFHRLGCQNIDVVLQLGSSATNRDFSMTEPKVLSCPQEIRIERFVAESSHRHLTSP